MNVVLCGWVIIEVSVLQVISFRKKVSNREMTLSMQRGSKKQKIIWNILFHFLISDSPKNQIIKPHVVCPAGKVLESVTLIGGITSGYFRDHGKVKDMQKCRRICCEMPHCHLAFMLSSNCFSVACKSASACKTQPANPSRYNPKISYVRDYASNDLLGKNDFYLTFFSYITVTK